MSITVVPIWTVFLSVVMLIAAFNLFINGSLVSSTIIIGVWIMMIRNNILVIDLDKNYDIE